MDSVKRSAGCLFLLIFWLFVSFCVFLCFTGVVGCGKMKKVVYIDYDCFERERN